jgi:methylmalonyl-CoA mutase cobalamin-binding subunit
VIVGAFRAQGTSFAEWCRKEGVKVNTASLATYGQAGGDRGRQMLERMINDANPDVVEAAYRRRMIEEAAQLQEVAG